MNKKVVAIDIGHAAGTGAIGNGLREHETMVRIGIQVKYYLEQAGFVGRLIDYPEESNRDDLLHTAVTANNLGVDVGLSLHADASDNVVACGGHCCYVSDSGRVLAGCIAKQIACVLPGRADTVVYRDDLYILKNTRAPWVLVECGFLTNAEDAQVLKSKPQLVAKAIADGVIGYFNRSDGDEN